MYGLRPSEQQWHLPVGFFYKTKMAKLEEKIAKGIPATIGKGCCGGTWVKGRKESSAFETEHDQIEFLQQ